MGVTQYESSNGRDRPYWRYAFEPHTIRSASICRGRGLSVANVYFAQPLLDELSIQFGFDTASAGLVVTVTQIGYALGLFLIVPLGDWLDRRRLVLNQLALSAVALIVVSFATTKITLLIGMFFVGLFAVVVQVLVAFAAGLALPEKRGSAVGTVTGGIVLGICWPVRLQVR